MGRIFGWIFNWQNGWLDDWHWRMILVGLSLGLLLESLHDSPNSGDEIPSMLLVTHIGFWLGSEAARCLCSCCRLIDCHEATFWRVGISYVPPFGAFITSKINSVRYFQLMDFLTFSPSPT